MWHLLYRLPLLPVQIIASLLSLVFCNPLGHRLRLGRYSIAQYNMLAWAKLTCLLFGLRVNVIGKFQKGPVLVVANHQSWQDIIALLSVEPLSFVAKQEIRHWPVVGFLVAAAGTLFLQRGNNQSSLQTRDGMHQALLNGKTVLIFPEAGVPLSPGVGRFYGRLLAPAIEQSAPIQPVAIRYLEREKLLQRSRFKANEGFLVSFFRLLTAPITDVHIHALDIIPTQTNSSRRDLALLAEQRVRVCYDPVHLFEHTQAQRQRPV